MRNHELRTGRTDDRLPRPGRHRRIAEVQRQPTSHPTTTDPDEDGEVRGFGLGATHPAVITQQAGRTESSRWRKCRSRRSRRLCADTPSGLGSWLKRASGSSKPRVFWRLSVTRTGTLLRTDRDPWQSCGRTAVLHRGKAPARDSEQLVHGREDARLERCAEHHQVGGPWRDLWDERRAHTEEALHTDVCVRCGPSGKPAQPGSPKSLAHLKADADRYVSKRLLRELWREARKLHGVVADDDGMAPYPVAA